MVVPLIMVGVQLIASGVVLVFTNAPRDNYNASPEAQGHAPDGRCGDMSPSRTTSVVFGVVVATLVWWLYSQFHSGTAMEAISWVCVRIAGAMRQGSEIMLAIRKSASVYAAFLEKSWRFITVAVLWIGWILIVTLRDISHKSPVSMVEMVLGLGLLYMMFFLKKLSEDRQTRYDDIRRRIASLESLQELRDIVEANLANSASMQESVLQGNAVDDAAASIPPRNAADDAIDSAAEAVLGVTTGVAKAVLHFFGA